VALATMFRSGMHGVQTTPGAGPTGYEDVPRDDATAAILFRRAADQGDLAGELNLGGMYENGEGPRFWD
jgi:TPR repeat protein